MQQNNKPRITINRIKTEVKSKETTPKIAESKDIACKHCNLHFSTESWLKKHIASSHASGSKTNSEQKTKILNYKKQLEVIQKTLDKKKSPKKVVAKQVSPTKQKLREQLKAQLAAQQKLLQVQQEIFEKTSKAQQDIFKLIAQLGDDSDADEVVEQQQQQSELVKCEDVNESEFYYDNPDGELIVADNVEEYAYLPENYEVEEQQLMSDDGGYVMLNDQQVASESAQDEQSVMVIVRSGDDEEEYELLDVVEDQLYDNNLLEHMDNGIDFEVVGKDDNSVHCRIIANEEPAEEIEYVDVQVDSKAPVKVDVGKIQQIAQKRFNKQMDKMKAEKTDETDSASKLLNATVNKSEKITNDYIQKVVQNAVPTDDNKFECPICREMVSNRYSLGPHILRLHSKQKSKICQFCDRSFTCTGDLTRYYLFEINFHQFSRQYSEHSVNFFPFTQTYPNSHR